IEDVLGQELRRRIDPLELRKLIEIAKSKRGKRRLELLVCPADVDDNSVLVEPLGQKCRANDERRPMQRLCGTENLATKRMRDHDLIGYFDREHANTPLDFDRTKAPAGWAKARARYLATSSELEGARRAHAIGFSWWARRARA